MRHASRLALLLAAAGLVSPHALAEGEQEDAGHPRRTVIELNAPGSVPYACHFGRFTVARHADKAGRFSVTGFGALVGGGELRHPVGANEDIPYEFPAESGVAEGSRLSVYCITGFKQADGSSKVAFSVGLGR